MVVAEIVDSRRRVAYLCNRNFNKNNNYEFQARLPVTRSQMPAAGSQHFV